MINTYHVLGRQIQVDPNRVYIKPMDGAKTTDIVTGTAKYARFDANAFLAALGRIQPDDFGICYQGLELHLMQCRSVLDFIEATEGEWNAEIIVEEGLVEGPQPKRTEELKVGLRNAIDLFEIVQGHKR